MERKSSEPPAEIFDLIVRSQHRIDSTPTPEQSDHLSTFSQFGRVLEGQVQLDALREALNASESGVDPEEVVAVGEVQNYLSGAIWGVYSEILAADDPTVTLSAKSWLDHLREIQRGDASIVLFPSRNPIDVGTWVATVMATNRVAADWKRMQRGFGEPPPFAAR